ncbi:MAG TPA: hypothetical protein VND80_05730 [Steroidobacteraceae bacterium]|nr:hypothetical protein [Steroidobacteraceae bacterium]
MKALGIVAALGAEARALRGARRVRAGVAALADGANVIVGGIGPAAAERAARVLADAGATALVSWGVAGGLDADLCAGAILLPVEILAEDGRRFATTPAWRERQHAALAAHHRIASGALLSRATAIGGAAAKATARRMSGAVAVDMESAAIAGVAAARRLPFLAVRVVVDAADDELPRAIVDASRGGRLRAWRLAAGILRSPRDLHGLLRLARRFGIACRTLADIAHTGLAPPP